VQPSAGPALAHTRARSVHWITTAAAVAAVIGAGALVPPAGATSLTRTVTAGATLQPPPNAKAAHYPLDCAGAPVDVVKHLSGDLDGDGRQETVAEVRCHAEGGTPPSGVYVLSAGRTPGSAPRIAATLVDPGDLRQIQDLRITRRQVKATVLGFSSDEVPRCCPDQRRSFTWGWRDGSYHVIPGPLADSV
jgi:hypothetical protein